MSGLSGLSRIVKIVWVNVQIANCFWIVWEIDGEIVWGIVLVVVRIVTGCPDYPDCLECLGGLSWWIGWIVWGVLIVQGIVQIV